MPPRADRPHPPGSGADEARAAGPPSCASTAGQAPPLVAWYERQGSSARGRSTWAAGSARSSRCDCDLRSARGRADRHRRRRRRRDRAAGLAPARPRPLRLRGRGRRDARRRADLQLPRPRPHRRRLGAAARCRPARRGAAASRARACAASPRASSAGSPSGWRCATATRPGRDVRWRGRRRSTRAGRDCSRRLLVGRRSRRRPAAVLEAQDRALDDVVAGRRDRGGDRADGDERAHERHPGMMSQTAVRR